jgi:hypothetical protein
LLGQIWLGHEMKKLPKKFRRAQDEIIYCFCGLFEGVCGKSAFSWWCFDGEIVVRCVVSVEKKLAKISLDKCATILNYFFWTDHSEQAVQSGRVGSGPETSTSDCKGLADES